MAIDAIGDFLTIIRNGIMVSKSFVIAPYSKMRFSIAEILKDEGFINDIVVDDTDPVRKKIKLFLRYVDGESAIHHIQRSSVPSRRYYAGAKSIKPVIGKLGISILTTNRGVITNKKARALGVGGEVICGALLSASLE